MIPAVEPRVQWDISVSGWIIQDGNYDDFYRGQIARFALECWDAVRRATTNSKMAHPLGHARYHIQGDVVYAAEQGVGAGRSHLWVIDFGIRAYRTHREERLSHGVAVGGYVVGEIGLGIDPYDYMEFHHSWAGIPPLSYVWRIDRISQMSAPWIPTTTPWGAGARKRDMSRVSYIDLDQTRAWEDESGHADYILHCTLINPEPTKPDEPTHRS